MSKLWTKRQIVKGNYLITDDTGDMIAITDARFADLLVAAPDLFSALQLLSKSVSMAGTPMKDVDMETVAAVVSRALGKATGDTAEIAAAVKQARGEEP